MQSIEALAPEAKLANFKKGMRRLAATVSIVTTAIDQQWHGMAATAICSVGIHPPSLLVSINERSSIHAPLLCRQLFCVNILHRNHHALVPIFSGEMKGQARFGTGAWALHDSGIPYLVDAQANMFCSVASRINYSGHSLIIGAVFDSAVNDEIAPLVYENGSLVRTSPLELVL